MTVVVTLLIVKHYGKLFDSLYTLAMVRVNYHTLTRKMSLSTPLCEGAPPKFSNDSKLSLAGHNMDPKILPGRARRERQDRARVIIDILPPSPLLSLPHSPSFSHVCVVICVLRDVFLACVSVSESELLWDEF